MKLPLYAYADTQLFVCLIGFYMYVTEYVIWRRSSFTGGGRPQVPFHELFQAQMGT
jgi:hypothetical protein